MYIITITCEQVTYYLKPRELLHWSLMRHDFKIQRKTVLGLSHVIFLTVNWSLTSQKY